MRTYYYYFLPNTIIRPIKQEEPMSKMEYFKRLSFWLANLFLTLEPLWSPHWNYRNSSCCLRLISSSTAIDHTAVFFYMFNSSSLNLNATLYVNNRSHQSNMWQMYETLSKSIKTK